MTQEKFEEIKALENNIHHLKEALNSSFDGLVEDDGLPYVTGIIPLDSATILRIRNVLKERLNELETEFEML